MGHRGAEAALARGPGAGERYAAYALSEPGAGSDVAAVAATARREGDVYVLNGEKMWISLATVAHNFLVFAKTDPRADPPHRGLSAFVVEREMPGVTTGDIHGKLGVRAAHYTSRFMHHESRTGGFPCTS